MTSTGFFFLFHNFPGRRFILIIELSKILAVFSFLIENFHPFTKRNHLRLPFGTANPPASLFLPREPVIQHVRVAWTRALWGPRDGWRSTPHEGTFHIQGGTAWDLITLLRIVSNLKLVNCSFLEFSSWYFQTKVDCRQLKLGKGKLWIRGPPVHHSWKRVKAHAWESRKCKTPVYVCVWLGQGVDSVAFLLHFDSCTDNTPIITTIIYGGSCHRPGPVLILTVSQQGQSTGPIRSEEHTSELQSP